MKLLNKLAILADAAKYDASCASSGTDKKSSTDGQGIGSTQGMGICHSYAPDGRCISLLKILLTNFCIYECSYCVNRASSQVPRARMSVDEVVKLTLDFYKRNYIEGLFLSSGIIKSPDYTMEQLVLVAKKLRLEHDFRGYIHLKTIPDADEALLREAGLYADRLSINVELPTEQSLAQLAPEKDSKQIKVSMARLRENIDESKASRKTQTQIKSAPQKTKTAYYRFAPAGQSTQMIIGADQTNDTTILQRSTQLYASYNMRRVYYSAFSPIPDASSALPLQQPPLIREHRLYQADWLIRFYGFEAEEITQPVETQQQAGMLDLDVDPKLQWALNNRGFFPVNLNKASFEDILRVPGIGLKTAQKIIQARKLHSLSYHDLQSLRVSMTKVKHFVTLRDHTPSAKILEQSDLKRHFVKQSPQLSLFGTLQ